MQQPESECLTPPPDSNPKRRRKPLSCEPCRHSKLRCDRQSPCLTCVKRGWQDQCTYEPAPRSESRHSPRRRRTRTRPSDSVAAVAAHSVQQAPGLEPTANDAHKAATPPAPSSPVLGHRDQSPEAIHRRWDQVLCRPPVVERTSARPAPADAISPMICFGPGVPTTELLRMLPPDAVCEYLLCWYFDHLCPLFRVIHGPTFQKQYAAFLKDPAGVDLSWLALLFAICSLTIRAIPPTDAGLLELWPPQHEASPQDLSSLSQTYRTAAMMSLAQDQFLVRHNLNTIEALLVVIHTIYETEGAEYGWALLGIAQNISLALRCHTADNSESDCIKRERRRRCWAGLMLLHTDQALLFRDTSLTFLCNMKTPLPVDANDVDILEDAIRIQADPTAATPKPTDMSFLRFNIRLFHLATDVCNAISKPSHHNPDETLLTRLDEAVQHEQRRWDALYLVDGDRSVLDATGYAHWCLLQTYAHQLYLLLHRPHHSSRSPRSFRQGSRDRCIASGLALMDIHRQLCELPRLRAYRWMVNGSISCNALHGAVALTSCVLDGPRDDAASVGPHIDVINQTALRIGRLRGSSPACASVHCIMRHLQSRLARPDVALSAEQDSIEGRFDDWLNNIDWFRPDDIGWDFWDADFVTPQTDSGQTVIT